MLVEFEICIKASTKPAPILTFAKSAATFNLASLFENVSAPAAAAPLVIVVISFNKA